MLVEAGLWAKVRARDAMGHSACLVWRALLQSLISLLDAMEMGMDVQQKMVKLERAWGQQGSRLWEITKADRNAAEAADLGIAQRSAMQACMKWV